MRRCDGDVSPPHGTRFNSEMISYWRSIKTEILFSLRKGMIAKPENKCGAAWSSWIEFLKEMILVREMKSIFIMEINKEIEVVGHHE